jgi:23S rRNA (guanosine2251-2'-O)-methyltransferase
MIMSLVLKNPHSVLAVLETRPQDVLQIVLPQKGSHEFWEKVARVAKEKRIPVVTSSSSKGKGPRVGMRGGSSEESAAAARMGTAEATVRERVPVSTEELFRDAKSKVKGLGLWLALDCLQDPHNVGAIFRAAAFFGVQGVLMTQERSAPLSGTVYDVACGGIEYVPFAVQTNLQQGFEIARDQGVWILGSSEHAHDDLATVSRDRPWLLVLGNEEKGMRRLTEESCDVLCKISAHGRVTSLNVSVASGIMISRLAAHE